MADRRILTPNVLRQLLRYEPETGKLYWRERGPEWFSDGRRDARWRANQWNAKWANAEAFTSRYRDSYYSGAVLGISVMAQRVAYSMFHGVHIENLREIDHISGDKGDNRIVNLREVSHSENARNVSLYKSNKTGVPGVMWEPSHKAWSAKINRDGKQRRIGRFKNFDDAVRARKDAERALGYHPNHGRTATGG